MQVIVNIGALLEAIRTSGFNGISQVATAAKVAPSTFHKLMRGELPRLDALQRICSTLKISERDLILGAAKSEAKDKLVAIERKKLLTQSQ